MNDINIEGFNNYLVDKLESYRNMDQDEYQRGALAALENINQAWQSYLTVDFEDENTIDLDTPIEQVKEEI